MITHCPRCSAALEYGDDAPASTREIRCPSCKQLITREEAQRGDARTRAGFHPAAGPVASAAAAPRAVPPPVMPPPVVKPRGARTPVPPPARVVPPVRLRPASDPMATQQMQLSDLPFVEGLDVALAGAVPVMADSAGSGWIVDRKDYQGATFTLDELADMAKRGWLERSDGVAHGGGGSFMSAGDHPVIAKGFALRQKMDAVKVNAQAAKNGVLACTHHPKVRAAYRCPGCSRVFCKSCGNETELRQQPAVLCLECDVAMAPLARP